MLAVVLVLLLAAWIMVMVVAVIVVVVVVVDVVRRANYPRLCGLAAAEASKRKSACNRLIGRPPTRLSALHDLASGHTPLAGR
ncbi:unnamed protein product [Protopolystoma xenopodis]|uniref:Uncharacterized protein n=1 Tax=Protopolystoma xenopodis TaxID=117903 RepID=A0A3S5CUX2_9PLAT|nr:unnamed protein product [Protopolystoma xenopodis]